MTFSVVTPDGSSQEIEFATDGALSSIWVAAEILKGKTYPHLPFVDDVRVVFDVGANCGAASVFLARCYPEAEVHCFEPAYRTREYLERNVSPLANVQVHPVGLYSEDAELPLFHGEHIINASLLKRTNDPETSETVRVRAAGAWTAEHEIDRIDVLKLDVEGVEVEVLEALQAWLPTVKVAYVEYDSRPARHAVERLFSPDHELYQGLMFMSQGECIYLRRDYAELPQATDWLRDYFRMRFAAQAG